MSHLQTESQHTPLDLKAFKDAGIEPKKRGVRENPKCCLDLDHDPRHPVTTFNLSAFCDDHYQPPPMFEGDPYGAGVITIGVPA